MLTVEQEQEYEKWADEARRDAAEAIAQSGKPGLASDEVQRLSQRAVNLKHLARHFHRLARQEDF